MLALALAWLAACDPGTGPQPPGPPPPPPPPPPPAVTPGNLPLRIEQVSPGAGGAILRITYPGSAGTISLGAASAGYQVRVLGSGAGELRLLVRGALAAGIVAQVAVPNTSATYSVQVLHLAGGAAVGYTELPPTAAQFRVGQ